MTLPSFNTLAWIALAWAVLKALEPVPAPDAVFRTATPLDLGKPARRPATIADVLGFNGRGWL